MQILKQFIYKQEKNKHNFFFKKKNAFCFMLHKC